MKTTALSSDKMNRFIFASTLVEYWEGLAILSSVLPAPKFFLASLASQGMDLNTSWNILV